MATVKPGTVASGGAGLTLCCWANAGARIPADARRTGRTAFAEWADFYLHGRKLTAPVHCLAMKFNA